MKGPVEFWEKLPDGGGIEVSSFGGVRSVNGHYYNSHQTNRGYLNVRIKIDGEWITKLVHRLVAQTFVPNPNNMTEVNHKDSSRTNNNASNLEWCTRSYNIKYKEKFGEPASKPMFAINLNTLETSLFLSRKEASRVLGLSVSRISSVVNVCRRQTHEFWFVNDDDNSVDLTKRELQYIDKTRLTAADTESADFVRNAILSVIKAPRSINNCWKCNKKYRKYYKNLTRF